MKKLFAVLVSALLYPICGCVNTHSHCVETRTETVTVPSQICSGWTKFGDCTSYMTINTPTTQTICIRTECDSGYVKNEKGQCVSQLELDIANETNRMITAAKDGDLRAVQDSLASGVDVNGKNAADATALCMASFYGHTDIVKLLLEKGADVNVKQAKTGATALWMASQQGKTEVVKLLLETKADINAKARDAGKNYTPLSIAKKNGYTQVVELLKNAGAKE